MSKTIFGMYIQSHARYRLCTRLQEEPVTLSSQMCGPLLAALASRVMKPEGEERCGEESEEVQLLCAQVFEVVLQKTPQV